MSLKKRDIPDIARPLAYRNYINSLGDNERGHRAMKELGKYYLEGSDYFSVTKHIMFFKKVLKEIPDIKDKRIHKATTDMFFLHIKARIKLDRCPQYIKNQLLGLLKNFYRDHLATYQLPIKPFN